VTFPDARSTDAIASLYRAANGFGFPRLRTAAGLPCEDFDGLNDPPSGRVKLY
jgi:hypothetical protein